MRRTVLWCVFPFQGILNNVCHVGVGIIAVRRKDRKPKQGHHAGAYMTDVLQRKVMTRLLS